MKNSWDDVEKFYGMSGPCDRGLCERSFFRLYELMGLERPQVVWVDHKDDVELEVGATRKNVFLRHRAKSLILGALGLGAKSQIVGATQVHTVVEETLLSAAWSSAHIAADSEISWRLHISSTDGLGQFDARWIAACGRLLEERPGKKCEIALEVAKAMGGIANGGFWRSTERAVYVMDRPSVLHLDDLLRPHCGTGPAVRYDIGVPVYAWGGVILPDSWFSSGELNHWVALTERNLERRRCAAEMLGWSTILEKSDASVIDAHEDPMIGTLYELTVPGDAEDGLRRYLKVTCGTGRQFCLRVPPTINTAAEANAWGFRLTVDPETLDLPYQFRT